MTSSGILESCPCEPGFDQNTCLLVFPFAALAASSLMLSSLTPAKARSGIPSITVETEAGRSDSFGARAVLLDAVAEEASLCGAGEVLSPDDDEKEDDEDEKHDLTAAFSARKGKRRDAEDVA